MNFSLALFPVICTKTPWIRKAYHLYFTNEKIEFLRNYCDFYKVIKIENEKSKAQLRLNFPFNFVVLFLGLLF